MAGALDEAIGKLKLGSTGRQTFVECAIETVTKRLGTEDWKDPSTKAPYTWASVALEQRFGDTAEKKVFEFLANPKLCELLDEPVYVISGHDYCQLKTDAVSGVSTWILGECDICLITRNHGIMIIEVKGKYVQLLLFLNIYASDLRATDLR